MRGSRKFFSEGVFLCFSLLGERRSKYHCKRTIMGPSAKRHLNGVSLAGRWWPNTECWLVRFVVLQGIRTNIIAKKPNIFVICQGGARTPCPPSGSAHGTIHFNKEKLFVAFPWVETSSGPGGLD